MPVLRDEEGRPGLMEAGQRSLSDNLRPQPVDVLVYACRELLELGLVHGVCVGPDYYDLVGAEGDAP